MRFSPAVRSSTVPSRATRYVSGITSPATTASPRPHAASTRLSSAPVTGFCVNITPATSGASNDCTTTPTLGRVNNPTRWRYVMAESELADHQISRSADGHVVDRRHVEQREVLAGEARVLAVLVDGRRAHRERRAQVADRGERPARSAVCVLARDRFDHRPRERDARRHREAVADGVAEADRLRAEDRDVARLDQRDDVVRRSQHDSIGCSLRSQHRHLTGGAVDAHAGAVGDALRWPRGCPPRRGCRTRAPRSPSVTAGRRCR